MSIEHIRPLDLIGSDKQTDILFINIPATFDQDIISDDDAPPFGLLRLSSLTDSYGYKTGLLDINRSRITLSEVDEILTEVKPNVVGINPTSINIPEAQNVAELCFNKGIKLVVGGVHATLDPYGTLKRDFPNAYAVMRGKGEAAVLQLLEDCKTGKETAFNGLYYQSSNSDRVDFGDYYPLDKLPLIDQGKWVERPIIDKVVNLNGNEVKLSEISLFETSGCPFRCTFCATPALVGPEKGYRAYHRPSMSRVVDDLKLSLATGANAIHFLDDMVFVSPNDFLDFKDSIYRAGLGDFYWRGMNRASIISHCSNDDLKILSESGCWRIAMGVESGDEEMLLRIRKGITLDQVKKSVFNLRYVGIPSVKAFFIMGFPGETMQQIIKTHDFIMDLKNYGLTDISVFQFKPYPGTEEWSFLEKTNPNVFDRLVYLRESGTNSLSDRKIYREAYLPDDLHIANVSGRVVREMVTNTIRDFYGE